MTGSGRPSPEPLLKKEASPAVLGGREFWKCSGAFKCLELQGLGHPSRTLAFVSPPFGFSQKVLKGVGLPRNLEPSVKWLAALKTFLHPECEER